MNAVSAGLTNRQIAEKLVLSRGTVKNHLNHIYAKSGFGTRAEAVSAWETVAGLAESYPCLFCDHTYTHAKAVIAHCAREHSRTLDSTEAVYGHVCPLCGETFARLAQHASYGHHRQIARLFADARRAGDPHGVVTALLRRYARLWLEDRGITDDESGG